MKLPALLLTCVACVANAQQYERDNLDSHDDGDDLQLVCFGQAENTQLENRSGVEWNSSRHRYEEKSEVVAGKHAFDSAVNLSIHGEQGRIRLPRQMIPPIHSGGSDGWWTIDDLLVGHNEIRGRFRLNAMNQPNIRIDRRSGVITLDGILGFNGRCEQDSGHRRF